MLPFTNEVITIVVGHEVYTFLYGILYTIRFSITSKDHYKTSFVTYQGAFVWVVMFFGVKSGPPTYQKVVTKTFHEYIDVFIKIFLYDYTIFSDPSTHFLKFKKCFLKCKVYDISLNLKKCAFMVYSRVTLRFIVSKEGKTHNHKKIEAQSRCWYPKHLRRSKCSMEWHNFTNVS